MPARSMARILRRTALVLLGLPHFVNPQQWYAAEFAEAQGPGGPRR